MDVSGIYEVGYATPAVDDENVYWVKEGQQLEDSFVMQTSRRGGATVTLAQGSATSIASDGAYVYWAERRGVTPPGPIVRSPVGGGAVTTLALSNSPECITLDDTNVYWTDTDYYSTASVATVAKIGGSTTSLAGLQTGPAAPTAIAVDSTRVYWSNGAIVSEPKKGGMATTLFMPPEPAGYGCGSLEVVGETLFFIDAANADDTEWQIVSLPITGSTMPTVVAPASQIGVLAVGGSGVYWADYDPALEIDSTPLDGGAITTLVTPAVNGISGLAVASDGTLYWATPLQIQAFKN